MQRCRHGGCCAAGATSDRRERSWVFYSVFDVRHNFAPELDEIASKRLSIFAMHPHAIVPLHGYVWVALCDQLLPGAYGYGTTTDLVMKIPLMRHMLGMMGVGTASKQDILAEMQGKDRNLYILPGGVAEIFLSRPRRHMDDLSRPNVQTIKARRCGLMKLALETGAAIYPMFVFGASDMLDQLTPAPIDGGVADHRRSGRDGSLRDALGCFVERISRSMQCGLTIFYGKYGLPVPHAPRLSVVMGDPILPVPGEEVMRNASGDRVTCRRVENPTEEQVEELMDRYVYAVYRLFEQYKAEAGYPKEKLCIV